MRTFKEIEKLVEEQERRGQSVPAFYAERGLHEKGFYVWRQRDTLVPPKFTFLNYSVRLDGCQKHSR